MEHKRNEGYVIVSSGHRDRTNVCSLDLRLTVQSVPITTEVVSSKTVYGEVCLIQQYVIKFYQWFVSDLWFSPCTAVFSTNKTGRHDITEIFLKVASNKINDNLNQKSACNIIQEYVLRQMLIRIVCANNFMDITVFILFYYSYKQNLEVWVTSLSDTPACSLVGVALTRSFFVKV